MTPAELAEHFGLPMTTAHPEIEGRLRCKKCKQAAGYPALINPAVGQG